MKVCVQCLVSGSNLIASTQYLLSIFPTPLIADSRKQSMGQWYSQLRCQRTLTGAVRHICSARSASRSICTSARVSWRTHGQARGPFDMFFPRAQVLLAPITLLSLGLVPGAGHRSSSNNISSTPAPDIGLIGHPLGPIRRPSTSGTTTPPSATSTSTRSLSTASPVRRSPSPKGMLDSSARPMTQVMTTKSFPTVSVIRHSCSHQDLRHLVT